MTVDLQVDRDTGELLSRVALAETELGRRRSPLRLAGQVWPGLSADPGAARERLARTGDLVGEAVLGERAGRELGKVADRLRPGDVLDVVVTADRGALAMPVELIRLPRDGQPGEALGVRAGIQVLRRLAGGDDRAPARLPGPLKILAAVAAPEETKTTSPPLQVEREMQALLDAVTDVTATTPAQLQILEVASLAELTRAVHDGGFHVLHLSAHGSPTFVELEDEDGNPVPVNTGDLVDALLDAGRPVPLIVLSSCSGAAGGPDGLAVGLVEHGADRVIAMQAAVDDAYATELTAALYRYLAEHPDRPVTAALAHARRAVERRELDRARAAGRAPYPGWALPVLFAAGEDAPLVNPTAPPVGLTRPVTMASGTSVRELRLGQLIGRRPQLRTATAILRRTQPAIDRYGAAAGVLLRGVGGIGKTAIAGRVATRLREDGWTVAVHEGAWNPPRLFAAVAGATGEPGTAQLLRDPGIDDSVKLDRVLETLGCERLLLVLDDFEQNLTAGGAFADPAVAVHLDRLCAGATTGAVLMTCRYPLPDDDRLLVDLPVPPLSPAELRRLFLRLPALSDLDPADRTVIARTIGGHPRLIEFTNALLQRGALDLREAATRLRRLARARGIDLRRDRTPGQSVDDAVLLGSADILLNDLISLLSPFEAETLRQLAVCRAPVTADDLAWVLSGAPDDTDPSPTDVRHAAEAGARLADLTLLDGSVLGGDLLLHPWIGAALLRGTPDDYTREQERAIALRLRRFELGRARYLDLLDLPRHFAAVRRYDDVVAVAGQGARMVGGTLASAAYLGELRPLIPATERAAVLLADLEMSALLAAGDLRAARQVALANHERNTARAVADPANTEWQRDLSVSHERLGDLAVAAGDTTTAADHYNTGLAIRERLAAADPANTEWQRDLSISHNRLGDLARAAGDTTTAADHYNTGLAIAERLAAADPANTEWQRDLSISHNRLGDLARAAGDTTTAADHYNTGLAIAERLAAADPANTEWQRDLSISHNRLGDLARAAGDTTTAADHYNTDLAIAERLAAADPANTEWQRDLEAIRHRLLELEE